MKFVLVTTCSILHRDKLKFMNVMDLCDQECRKLSVLYTVFDLDAVYSKKPKGCGGVVFSSCFLHTKPDQIQREAGGFCGLLFGGQRFAFS